MKSILPNLLLPLLLLCATLSFSNSAYSQAETHNFITYDTTFNVGYASLSYILRITRPANMFTANNPDTASRPAIIQMGGVGEVGTNPALTAKNGPHYWLANGWDGGVVLANGTHYPIIISVQASQAWPQTKELLMILTHILNTYHIKRNSVHLCGLSMGAMAWSAMICHQTTPGGEDAMKLVTSLTCLEGQSNTVSASATANELPGYASFGHWAKKYNGKFFGLEGVADFRNVALVSKSMNDSVPGSAFFSYETLGGGAHCCWNSMFDPAATNWTSLGILGPNNATGADANTMGTYKSPSGIFQWMLSQGDTTLLGTAPTPTPAPNQAPVVNAGTNQTITLPASSATLTGSATDEGGTLTYLWTKISGPAGDVIGSNNTISTTISALQQGTYIYQLAVTDTGSLTGKSQVTVIVNAAPNLAPVISAGNAQSITSPSNAVTLTGTATPAAGTTITTYSWTQLSGATAVISSPTAASTGVAGLSTGSSVFRLTVTSSSGDTATSDVQITVNPPVVIPASGSPIVTKVAVAEYRTGYLASDGNVYSFLQSPLFKYNYGGRKIVDVTAGFNLILALDDQGYVWTTQIGTNAVVRYDTDTTGAPFNNNTSIYGYTDTYTSIRSDGSLWYWGLDTFHLYHSTGGVNLRPVQLSPAGMQVKKVVMGLSRILVLTTSGQVWEWVRNGSLTPVQKSIPRPAIDIFGSHWDYAGCIIPDPGASPTSGYPYVWGSNYGFWGGNAPYTQPTSIKSMWNLTVPIKEISTNFNTTHYIDTLGRMFGIGDNPMGEVGNGTELVNQYNYATFPGYGWDFGTGENLTGAPPVQIGVGVKWKKLFSNNFLAFYKYALDENDSLYFWGRDKAMVSGRAYLDLQEAAHPNGMDVLAPLMVHPLSAVYQTYNWKAPAISAGANQNITSLSTTLTGSAMAPLLIKSTATAANNIDTVGYKIVSYTWTKVSGTGGTITTPDAAITTVTGLVPGTYVFNLKTKDSNTGTQSANVTVTVSTAVPGNQAPVANAGISQTITLPTSSATLTGSGVDSDGTVASYLWSQVSGPASAGFGSATQAQTAVTGLVQGVYLFQLTVFDNLGAAGTDTVTVTVNPAPVVPGSPSANAGADQVITLPVNSATLTGSGSETNGTIVSYQWTQVSGPSAATIATPAQAQTTVSGLVQGVYTYQLTVTDNSGIKATAQVKVTANAAPAAGNQPPVANAGANQTSSASSGITLDGSASYDPDGTIVKYAWSQLSGSGGVTITNSGTARPILYGLQLGVYVFQLTVTDNMGATASAQVTVTMTSAAAPGNPVAIAGNDTTIYFPGSTTSILDGSASYDPGGTIISYSWRQVSGPAAAQIDNSSIRITGVEQLIAGAYVFELTVTDDKNLSSTSTVKVTVLTSLRHTGYVRVYPNPVLLNGQVTVEGMNDNMGKVKFTLFDIGGRTLKQVMLDKQSTEFRQTISMDGLGKGAYILSIVYSGNSKPEILKLIID